MPCADFFCLNSTRLAIIQQVIETHVKEYSASFYRMKGTLTRSGNVLRSVLTLNCYQRRSSGLSLRVCFDPLQQLLSIDTKLQLEPRGQRPRLPGIFCYVVYAHAVFGELEIASKNDEGSSLLVRLDLVNPADEFLPLNQIRISTRKSRRHREHTITTRQYGRLSRCFIHGGGLEISDQEDLAAMCSDVKALPH